MKLHSCVVTIVVLLLANLISLQADADPYPPVDQKRPALVLKSHGIFWAGGRIVNRTQSGTQNAGDLKNIPYNQQQVLVGQAYVEYFIPHKLRNGKNTPPVVMVPGGALIGVHFLTTPDGREGWAHYFLRRGFPVYIVDVPGRGRAGFMLIEFGDAFDFTGRDFDGWCRKIGFRRTEVIPLRGPASAAVAYK